MNDVWQQIGAYLQSDQGRAQFGGAADALAQQGGWSTMPSGGVAQNIATALAGARQGRREQEALDYAKSRDATQDRFNEIGLYLDQQRLNQGMSAPSSVREWEYFNSLSPEDQKRYLSMKRTQKTVDLGGSVAGLDPMTNLPSYQMPKTLPPQSQPENLRAGEYAKVTGRDDAETEIGAPKARQKLEAQLAGIDNVVSLIEDTQGMVTPWTAGRTGAVSALVNPGTDSYTLRKNIETIKGNIGFDRLQQMRDMSPTGGALGQVAVQELNALQNVISNLDPNQSDDVLKSNLQKVKDHYLRWRQAMTEAHGAKYGENLPEAPMTIPGEGDGWSIRKK